MKKTDKKGLLTIQEFAKLCRTTSRTPRFYEQKGLFAPDRVDQFTKYRFYNPQRIRDFFQIKLLQDFSIPLSDIKTMLFSDVSENVLQKKIRDVHRQIEEKEKEYEFLKHMKYFLFADEDITKQFKKEPIGSFVLLSKRTTQGRYDQIGKEMEAMITMAQKRHISLEGTQITFYEDTASYKPVGNHLELAVVVDAKAIPDMPLPEGYSFRLFPKTSVIFYPYKGPYAYITLIYQKLEKSGFLKGKKTMDMHIPVKKGMSEYEQLTKIAFRY